MAVWRVGGGAVPGARTRVLVGLRDRAVIALHNARLFDEDARVRSSRPLRPRCSRVISSSPTDASRSSTRSSCWPGTWPVCLSRWSTRPRRRSSSQTATAEVLEAIGSSVADTKPVFEKILESGRHLFGSDEMDVLLVDEQGQLLIEAYVGDAHVAVAVTFPAPVERTPAGRAIRERRVMGCPTWLAAWRCRACCARCPRWRATSHGLSRRCCGTGRGIGAIAVTARSPRPASPTRRVGAAQRPSPTRR